MTPRGCLTLVFDDGYQKVFNDVVPLLRRYNYPAVFAISLDSQTLTQETNQPFTHWQQWLTLAPPHEIAAHSLTHSDLTTLTPNTLEQELKQPSTTLNAHTLVYPGGANSKTVRAKTTQYYRAARTLERGFNQLSPTDPLRLKTFNYTRHNYSLWLANLRVLQAVLTNSWLIETYHLVDESTPLIHSVKLSDFTKHLTFIARLPIAVKTIKQVLSP
jgi:peptidoglycan/xylan/chitin deacetylase (PgdA/CDA1 family)